MAEKSVWLNSNEYKISGKVFKTALPIWTDATRPTTEESRDYMVGVGKWVIKFEGGFGRYIIPENDPYNRGAEAPTWETTPMTMTIVPQAGRWYDSTLETRWAKEDLVTLPAKVTSPTVTASGTYTDVYFLDQCDFSGELYALVQQFKTGPLYIVSIFRWTGSTTTWARVADLGIESTVVSTGSRGYLKAIGNTLYAYVLNAEAGPTTDIRLYSSTDGTTWSAAKAMTGRVAYGASDQAGPLLQKGDEIVITYWDNSAGLIYCYTSSNGGVNVVQITSIPSSGIPIGLTLWQDEVGNAVPWLRTKENAGYLTTDAYIPVLDTPGTKSNDFGLVTWKGHLYCPLADGLEDCWYENGVFTSREIGLNENAQLTSTRWGTVTSMVTSAKWLFVGYGQATAGFTANIYAWDNTRWHHIQRAGAAAKNITNLCLSFNDDSIGRLHYVYESTATATLSRHLNYILESPRGGNWTYSDNKTYVTPYFDAGMGEINGVLLEIHLVADSLSATSSTDDAFVTCRYGTNGAAQTTTTLGSFVSGTKKLSFGTNNAGIAFKNVSFDFLVRGHSDGTTSPKIYYAVLYFQKKPARRYQWRFTIDLTQQPVWNGERVDSVTQLSNLETDIDTVTLLPFRYGEIQTDKYVQITELLEDTEWVEHGDRILPQGRDGRVAVTVETPL